MLERVWFITTKKITKNLIILSGNGDTEYINTSYQRRYLDTKMLLEKNKFKKFLLWVDLRKLRKVKL